MMIRRQISRHRAVKPDEHDWTTGWRKVLYWKAGEGKAVKRRINRRFRRYDLTDEICEAFRMISHNEWVEEEERYYQAWREEEQEPDFFEWYSWYKSQCH